MIFFMNLGYAYIKFKSIKFNINGVFYNRMTDKNGFAYLNINLMAGKYIISSSYDGCTISNTIIIN